MPFSHILITRPREEAKELAELLAPSGVEVIVLPAHDFHITRLFEDQLGRMTEAVESVDRPLLVFTSTRSVEFGLDQIERAYHALLNTPETRQVILQIWKPEIDISTKTGQPASPG